MMCEAVDEPRAVHRGDGPDMTTRRTSTVGARDGKQGHAVRAPRALAAVTGLGVVLVVALFQALPPAAARLPPQRPLSVNVHRHLDIV
jgi:hypothetical protein